MSVRFKANQKSTGSPIADHNDLLNIGTRTHEELDNIHAEVVEARDGEISIFEKIKKVITSIITKHSQLQEIGTKTHDELDEFCTEIETAREGSLTLLENLTEIRGLIVTDHNNLANKGVKTHTELDNLYSEVETARGTFQSLDERLDSIKPVLTFDDLSDVDTTGIQNGQTIIFDEATQTYKPGTVSGGGGGTTPTKLSFTQTVEYDAEGNVNREIFSGDINKTINYTYVDGVPTTKTVTFSNGIVKTATYNYNAQGDVSSISDTGTEEVYVASGGGMTDEEKERLSNLENLLNQVTTENRKTILRMQFKYDIALNLVKNYCSDYFIDVLQDDSNIESYDGASFSASLEDIE